MQSRYRYIVVAAIVLLSVAINHIAKGVWGRTGQILAVTVACMAFLVVWIMAQLAERFEKKSQEDLKSIKAELEAEEEKSRPSSKSE